MKIEIHREAYWSLSAAERAAARLRRHGFACTVRYGFNADGGGWMLHVYDD